MSLSSIIDQASNLKYDVHLTGLTVDTVRTISCDLQEPEWMLDHRLQCLHLLQEKMHLPSRGPDLSELDMDQLVWYARPSKDHKGSVQSRDEVPTDLKEKFEKLGIPESERSYLAGAGGQMDSESVYHKIKETRSSKGVVFEDISEALHHPEYEPIIRKYFMKCVPPQDHYFACLHGAVRSGGTFIYVPAGVVVDQPLQSYFRMNVYGGGQFEHTLIVIEDDAEAQYIEGCSAPKFDQASLHAGLVEIFIGKRAKLEYSSVENRSQNTYNLNTKRAIVGEDGYIKRVSGNMGSCKTMLYPCSVLQGTRSKSDALGIVVAGQGQDQDVGNKVIHIGADTSSTILSKSISKDGGVTTYRGLVKILPSAIGATNATNCDGLMMDAHSVSKAIPDISVSTGTAVVSHEASAGRVDEGDLLYLMSRGISESEAMAMIVNGFFADVVKKLPLEYAGELNKLIEMEFE